MHLPVGRNGSSSNTAKEYKNNKEGAILNFKIYHTHTRTPGTLFQSNCPRWSLFWQLLQIER